MAQIKDMNWRIEVSLTRAEIHSLAILSKFSANLKSYLEEGFPSASKEMNWSAMNDALGAFSLASKKDKKLVAELGKVLTDLEKKN